MVIVTAASQPAQHGLLRSIVLPCCLALLALFVIQQFRSWYRLRHVPGPFWASITSFWMLRKALTGKLHEHLRDAAEKYGSLRSLSPPTGLLPLGRLRIPLDKTKLTLTQAHSSVSAPTKYYQRTPMSSV